METREEILSLLSELERRAAARQNAQKIIDGLFDQQRVLAEGLLEPDGGKWAVLTSRRAGKSWALCAAMAAVCCSHPGSKCLYLALTRMNVKRFAWSTIKKLDRIHDLEIDFHEGDLVARFPNGSLIEFAGADSPRLPDRYLGADFDIAAIDEAGSFDPLVLGYLITEVLEQTLIDRYGRLVLTGTPKEIEAGLFWDVTGSGDEVPGWHVLKWSTGDNPWMREQWLSKIAEKKAEQPGVEETPAFIRDYLGKWCSDKGDLVYRFGDHNLCSGIPDGIRRWVIGVDFGWNDDTAFVLGCVVANNPRLWIVDAFKKPNMLTDAIASVLRDWTDQRQPCVIVGDTSAKTVCADLQSRWGIGIFAAKKDHKREAIRSMNTDFSSGRIRVLQDACGPLIKELRALPKKKHPETGVWKEHPGFANHLCDAALYMWRHARGWMEKEEIPKPDEGERIMIEQRRLAAARKNAPRWHRGTH